MNCKKAADMMSDYLDDCLTGRVRLDFEVHIEECDECSTRLAAMEKMLVSLRSLREESAPASCTHAVMSAISRRTAVRQTPWFLRPAFAMPVLVLAIVIALLIMTPGHFEPSLQNQVNVPEYTKYISAHSRAQNQQVLSDPHVTFISAELEKASLMTEASAP